MINIFIMSIYCIFSFMIFTGSYRVNEVNRAFITMPKSLIENAVTIKDYYEETDIYIVPEFLEENVRTYFKEILSPKAFDFVIRFNYLKNDGYTYCVDERCQGVKITILCEYFMNFVYKNSMVYTIGEAR